MDHTPNREEWPPVVGTTWLAWEMIQVDYLQSVIWKQVYSEASVSGLSQVSSRLNGPKAENYSEYNALCFQKKGKEIRWLTPWETMTKISKGATLVRFFFSNVRDSLDIFL